MKLKEFKMLSTVFVFVFVTGLIFMLQAHDEQNVHSDVIYIDEYQIVTNEDEQTPVEETDVPQEQYASQSRLDQVVELIGFVR